MLPPLAFGNLLHVLWFKNAGAAYCHLVQHLVDMLGEEGVLEYLNDLLIHTNDPETHLKLLKLVFQAHWESGIKINLEKTNLFRQEVEYSGHLISENGIKLLPSYVNKITEWPMPTTEKELAAFLGF